MFSCVWSWISRTCVIGMIAANIDITSVIIMINIIIITAYVTAKIMCINCPCICLIASKLVYGHCN